ncbi:hypothetical protein CJF31_00005046 [Rutstroemia sp. NJR-2017a BVV2]|nr:hypothetical protein CJF31_00005046 [Rutstroemia sp. NJR-2017a BVV2]
MYSPFDHGLRYGIETTPGDYWQNRLYMGEPSDELEQAWNYLIHPTLSFPAHRGQHGIRLFPEEATWLNISQSIRLTDNSLASIIIFIAWQVHISPLTGPHTNLTIPLQRRLRQIFYGDHYYPNWSEEDRQRIRGHNTSAKRTEKVHCLESLRTSTICRPDLAPLPFYWSGNDWHQMSVSAQVKRECVDWDFFQDHVIPRSYDTSELVRDRV